MFGLRVLLPKPQSVLLSSVLQRSNASTWQHHWGTKESENEPSNWMKLNESKFEPLKPGEERRPAYVCNEKRDIWHSYKKLYVVACYVRGLRVDDAIRQLSFLSRKGAMFVKDTIEEAQDMAVREHNVEFRSNLWVAESFVEKSFYLKGVRRHRGGRMGEVRLQHCHYFVRLEEGDPPEHYYHYRRQLTGQELLDDYMSSLRKRKVINSL